MECDDKMRPVDRIKEVYIKEQQILTVQRALAGDISSSHDHFFNLLQEESPGWPLNMHLKHNYQGKTLDEAWRDYLVDNYQSGHETIDAKASRKKLEKLHTYSIQ